MLFALSAGRRVSIWFVWAVVLLLLALVVLAHKPVLRLLYPLHYQAYIEDCSRANGLDPRLVAAVIRVESRFDPMAESQKGARGLMQILPSTGSWIAGKLGYAEYHPDLLYEPGVSIHIGSWYLAYLVDLFDGRMVVALAAYNGGTTNVKSWLDTGVWDGTLQNLEAIPFEETRNFVRRIMHDYRVYRWAYPNPG